MKSPNDSSETLPPEKILPAQMRMALWPLVMYGIALVWAYLSLPFEGHATSTENVVYGLWAASPFWISIGIFLAGIRRERRSKP